MSDRKGLSRRDWVDAIAGASLAAAAVSSAQARPADEEKKIEPIPPFKYNIESRPGWQGPGGSAFEATVEEFPVSQSIAGVSMRLKAGGLRELHWHICATSRPPF
jgi:oxalate decarboxylase